MTHQAEVDGARLAETAGAAAAAGSGADRAASPDGLQQAAATTLPAAAQPPPSESQAIAPGGGEALHALPGNAPPPHDVAVGTGGPGKDLPPGDGAQPSPSPPAHADPARLQREIDKLWCQWKVLANMKCRDIERQLGSSTAPPPAEQANAWRKEAKALRKRIGEYTLVPKHEDYERKFEQFTSEAREEAMQRAEKEARRREQRLQQAAHAPRAPASVPPPAQPAVQADASKNPQQANPPAATPPAASAESAAAVPAAPAHVQAAGQPLRPGAGWTLAVLLLGVLLGWGAIFGTAIAAKWVPWAARFGNLGEPDEAMKQECARLSKDLSTLSQRHQEQRDVVDGLKRDVAEIKKLLAEISTRLQERIRTQTSPGGTLPPSHTAGGPVPSAAPRQDGRAPGSFATVRFVPCSFAEAKPAPATRPQPGKDMESLRSQFVSSLNTLLAELDSRKELNAKLLAENLRLKAAVGGELTGQEKPQADDVGYLPQQIRKAVQATAQDPKCKDWAVGVEGANAQARVPQLPTLPDKVKLAYILKAYQHATEHGLVRNETRPKEPLAAHSTPAPIAPPAPAPLSPQDRQALAKELAKELGVQAAVKTEIDKIPGLVSGAVKADAQAAFVRYDAMEKMLRDLSVRLAPNGADPLPPTAIVLDGGQFMNKHDFPGVLQGIRDAMELSVRQLPARPLGLFLDQGGDTLQNAVALKPRQYAELPEVYQSIDAVKVHPAITGNPLMAIRSGLDHLATDQAPVKRLVYIVASPPLVPPPETRKQHEDLAAKCLEFKVELWVLQLAREADEPDNQLARMAMMTRGEFVYLYCKPGETERVMRQRLRSTLYQAMELPSALDRKRD
jgi:hypothetical protein